MKRADAILRLKQNGWKINEQPDAKFVLPPDVAVRYPNLPAPLIDFLAGLSSCADADETTWFLCQSDYNGTSDSAFSWDEWETLSLDCADDDEDVVGEIRQFWDTHFPFLFAVHSGYSFYAVRTAPDGFGQIVQGFEPEFEAVTVVAESFELFLDTLVS